MPVDRPAARRAIADFLRAMGRDLDADPELQDTPQRVTDAWAEELVAGYEVDVPKLLEGGSRNVGSDVVVMKDLAVATLCPHHLLPSQGTATLAYDAGSRVFGLGTLAALVDAYARRLALQEALGQQIVDALVNHGGAHGAFCRLDLGHACLALRGERRPEARIVTTASAGSLATAEGRVRMQLALGLAGSP